MSQQNTTLSELIDLLQQINAKELKLEALLPKIKSDPVNIDVFISTLTTIIKEGETHHSTTWASHMTPPVNSVSLVGKLTAAIHNGNLLSPKLYPVLNEIKQQLLSWFCQRFQYKNAHFTAGSTYANLEALWHAKEFNTTIQSNIVYGSSACHYSIIKACQILGLNFIEIASDEFDRIKPGALSNACNQNLPIAIVLNVGTSACGEIDPLIVCLAIAKEFQSWCHIDAAWGGASALLSEYKELNNLISQANSLCFDPHKSMGQPKPCGLLFYQQALKPIFDNVDYLDQRPNATLPGSFGGELFLPLWADLLSNGWRKTEDYIQQRLIQASKFAAGLDRNKYFVHQSATGIVCFRPHSEEHLNQDLLDRGIFSRVLFQKKPVYRAVFASPLTKASGLLTELARFH